MVHGYIYRITNIVNGIVYIGQSTNIYKRLSYHRKALENNSHGNQYMQNAWNKYGEENFAFEIIDEANEQFELNNLEEFWVNAYGGVESSLNYNLRAGGGNCGHLSEHTKNKIGSANKGKIRTKDVKALLSKRHKGRVGGFAGKKHSEESKQKISESNKGRIVSEETRQKISDSNKGKIRSEETRKRNSEAHKGKKLSDETKQKISEAQSGEKHWNYGKATPEIVKQKMRKSNPLAKKVICLETKQVFDTISEAAKWAESTAVGNCCKGRIKTAGGYHWMFYDEYLANEKIDNQQVSPE